MQPASIARSVLALCVGLLSQSADAQKAPDVRVDRNAPGSGFSTYPTVAASGNLVYVCWCDTRSGDSGLYLNRSADGGATWSLSEARLDDAAAGSLLRTPQLVADGNTVVAVWVEQRTGVAGTALYANRSVDGGATWLPQARRIDSGVATESVSPRIAMVGAHIYVTWEDDRSSLPSEPTKEIYFSRSTDAGNTWQPDVRLNTDNAPAFSRRPQIAADSDSVYVVWEDDRNGSFRSDGDIYFNRSLDNGASWLPNDVRLDTDLPGNGHSVAPEIAGSENAVYAVWQEHRSGAQEGDIHFNRSLDNGTTWLPDDVRLDTDLPAGTFDSVTPQVGASGSNVFVVWSDNRATHAPPATDLYCNRSLDHGTTWLGTDVRVNATAGTNLAATPGLTVSDSAVAIAWPDSRNSAPAPLYADLYYNRSRDGGLTWLGADVRLDVGKVAASSSLLSASLTSSGHAIYAAWTDGRNGLPNVFFNIPAGLHRYGAGKPGSGGFVPSLDGTGPALLGETFNLESDNALGGANALLAISGSRAAVPIVGGTVLVGVPLVSVPVVLDGQPGVPGDGNLSLPVTVPDFEPFVGVPLFFQLLPLDPGASWGVSMSNGVELWMG